MVLKDAIDKILGVNSRSGEIDDLIAPEIVQNIQVQSPDSDRTSLHKIDSFFEKRDEIERELFLYSPNPDKKLLYDFDRVDLVIKGMKELRANIRKAQNICVSDNIQMWRAYEDYVNKLDIMIAGLEGHGVIVNDEVMDNTFGPKRMVISKSTYPFATLESFLADHPELGYNISHSLRIRDGNGQFISPQKLSEELKKSGLLR